MTSEATQSDYRQRLFLAQRAMEKTRGDALWAVKEHGVMALGAAALMTVVVGGGIALLYDPPDLGGVGEFMRRNGITFEQLGSTLGLVFAPLVLLGVAFVLALPFLLLGSSLRVIKSAFAALAQPARTVRCPRCSSEQQIFAKVEQYVCPACNVVMRPFGRSELVLVECPSCSMGGAIGGEDVSLACSNCGASAVKRQGVWQVEGASAPCPSCEAAIPASTEFCPRCNHVAATAGCAKVPDALSGFFLDPDRDVWSVRGGESQSAVERLLGRNEQGTVADATSRIRAAAESVDAASLSALLGCVSSRQLDLAVVQMLDGDTARVLSGRVVANLREADRAHATCLRALGERLVQDTPSFASRSKIDDVALCYLRQRNRLLAKLREVGEPSASEFREIQLEVPVAPQSEEAVTTLFGGAGNISRGSTARTHFELGYIVRAEGGDVGYAFADPEVLREVATALER